MDGQQRIKEACVMFRFRLAKPNKTRTTLHIRQMSFLANKKALYLKRTGSFHAILYLKIFKLEAYLVVETDRNRIKKYTRILQLS